MTEHAENCTSRSGGWTALGECNCGAERDHWKFFSYSNIYQEARLRFLQAVKRGATGREGTFEYWIAWVAHANAAACL